MKSTLTLVAFVCLAACTGGSVVDVGTPEDPASSVDELQVSPAPAPESTPATDGCTVTTGPCHHGRCEFPNDTYQMLTEVCCTNGVCETEHYRLCGC